MRQDELAHILRAAATISGDPNILVIGSQSVLGTYDETQLPEDAYLSIEADLAWPADADPATAVEPPRSDQVDGAIGELSMFHDQFGYYAQGVDVSTAQLPEGWRERLVRFPVSAAYPAEATCLDVADLVLSKLAVMRDKDIRFATALLTEGLVELGLLRARLAGFRCITGVQRNRIRRFLDRAESALAEDDDTPRATGGSTA